MNFTQIKIHKNRVHLEYLERKDDDHTDHMIDSPDGPLKSFTTAFSNITEDFISILELPKNLIERTKVHTINISYNGEDHNRNVIVSANISIEKTKDSFNVNTPLRSLDSNEGGKMLELTTAKRFEILFVEAEKFINGSREQINLFEMKKKAAN
jgi:hypothetical protein